MIIEKFKCKSKIPTRVNLKQIFCKCEGQSDLEGQGNGQKFLE